MPTNPPAAEDPLADESLAPPSEFRPDARRAFRAMIKSAGTTLHLMPTSCELYVRQHLGPFEPERLALVEALRRGVPGRIAKHAGGNYDDFLKGEADSLAKAAGLTPGAAWGAVECWALGVGRPAGSSPSRPVARSLEIDEPKPTGPSDSVRLVMNLIATAGGFTGGFLGNGVAFLTLLGGFLAVDASGPDGKGPGTEHAVALLAIVIGMLIGGVAGAIGSGLGWLMGRGDEKPWAGFAAGAGAAFGAGLIMSAIRGAGLVTAIAIMIAAFGATYKAASSGGYRS